MDSRIIPDTITRRVSLDMALPVARYFLARMGEDDGSNINPELKAIREELQRAVKLMDKTDYPEEKRAKLLTPHITRDILEIIKAHDVLEELFNEETPFDLQEKDKAVVYAVLEVLCWVLLHSRGEAFQSRITDLYMRLIALGIDYKPREEPPPEPPV